MEETVKELQKGIQEILVAVAKIQTELYHLANMQTRQQDTERNVIIMEHSLKAAHTNIDTLNDRIANLEGRLAAEKKASKDDYKWLVGALPGVGAFIITIWKYIKGGV